jgi:hypothetical protein
VTGQQLIYLIFACGLGWICRVIARASPQKIMARART